MSIGDPVIVTFVPPSNVILSCWVFKAFCKFTVLDITRLPKGNETEPLTNKSDILEDDEWIVVLCNFEKFEKGPAPTFLKSVAAKYNAAKLPVDRFFVQVLYEFDL